MKKLWKRYCNRVDKHNEHVGQENHEEHWEYETIFYPFLQALIITFFVWGFTSCSLTMCVISYIVSFIIMSLTYLINWMIVENSPNHSEIFTKIEGEINK